MKKYADFGQAEKISIQLDDEYYKNGENVKIRKITIIWIANFPDLSSCLVA